MISLKRYLDSDEQQHNERAVPAEWDPLSAAIDAYGAALVEMGGCSQEACPGVGDGLKLKLEDCQSRLSPKISSEALAETDRGARGAIRDWGREVARHFQQKACEVKELLLAVARTAESVSARDQQSADRMSQVTGRLKAIASLEDLTEIRAEIEKNAAELKTSIDRMTEEGRAVVAVLRGQVASYQTKLEEAERIASRDALTGLSSRLYVEGQLERRIAANAPLCVAMIDIDEFKKVNDIYGHGTGDELLKQFGAELRYACRATDVIGRWGGDEFIILFDYSLKDAEVQVERVRKWICGNYTVRARSGQLKLRVDASIGLAVRTPGEPMKDLLARADAAMYERKAAARSGAV